MVSLKAKYKYEMADAELETYVSKEEDKVIAKLKASLRPCVGADAELEKLEKGGKYTLAVVSSSALRRVKASVVKVGQDKFFGWCPLRFPFPVFSVLYLPLPIAVLIPDCTNSGPRLQRSNFASQAYLQTRPRDLHPRHGRPRRVRLGMRGS